MSRNSRNRKQTPWRLDRAEYDPDDRANALGHALNKALDNSNLGKSHRLRYVKPLWIKPTHWIAILVIVAIVVGTLWKSASENWSTTETILHFAAFPNCSAVRILGLAPAWRDRPGYYSRHDRDLDGIACEPHLTSHNLASTFIQRMKAGDREYTKRWQLHLKEQGFLDSEIDGIYGPRTREAMALCALRSDCLYFD